MNIITKNWISIVLLFGATMAGFLYLSSMNSSSADENLVNDDRTIINQQKYEEFVAPENWHPRQNNSIGISLFAPSDWTGSNVGGPINPLQQSGEKSDFNSLYLIPDFSPYITPNGENSTWGPPELRITKPSTNRTCTPIAIEPIAMELNTDAEIVALFCQVDSDTEKVKSILVSDKKHEIGIEYKDIGVKLGEDSIDFVITFISLNQPDQRQRQTDDLTLDQIRENESFQAIINIMNTVRAL